MKTDPDTMEVKELDAMECIEITGTFRVTHFEVVENETIELETIDGDE